MKKIFLFLSFSLLFVSFAKAQGFDPQPLKNEIATLDQAVVKARAESGQYSGGLIKVLLDSRIQILENTKVLLEQRLAAGNYGVKISYKVDGKEYIPPANKAEIIKNLESEAQQVAQELANAKQEADKYSGGLVRAMALSTAATAQQHLAMLDMKRCALIYDIPLFAFIAGGTNTDMSEKTPVPTAGLPKEAPSEIDSKSNPPNTKFRGTSWGMTMEAVKKNEGKEPTQVMKSNSGLDTIAFKGKAGNLDCLCAYYFADDKLVEGRYIFMDSHTNKNSYIADFNTVKDSLTEKYGKPNVDHLVWNNNLYKDDQSEWGMAVALGHLAYEAIWTLDDTKITLRLTGDNFKFQHMLQYLSTLPEHIELTKKAMEKAKKGIW